MWPFKSKDLREVLNQTKKLKIKNVLFEIRKIDMLNYLDGSQVLLQFYRTWEDKRSDKNQDLKPDKVRLHMIDIIMAGTIHPILTREDPPGENINVNDLFKDPDISGILYSEILTFSYGKKKVSNI